MSAEGNLRARFTNQVRKVTAPAEELREHLRAAPSNQLLLSAVHVTGDTSLLDRYADKVGGNSVMGRCWTRRTSGQTRRRRARSSSSCWSERSRSRTSPTTSASRT